MTRNPRSSYRHNQPVNPGPHERRGWFSRGYLPHFDAAATIQHVTFHLADSLPKSAIAEIEHSLDRLPNNQRTIERRKRLNEWIDAGHGSCILLNPDIAEAADRTLSEVGL